MITHICPPFVGYFLIGPWRRWFGRPERHVEGLVCPGMTVLEPGPAMGYFTLPLAKAVGPEGRVIAVDVQQKMLDVLHHRADRAGLGNRVETRHCARTSLCIGDLDEDIDLAVLIHMLHEVPDPRGLLAEVFASLKPGASAFLMEPRGYVSVPEFEAQLGYAWDLGFTIKLPEDSPKKRRAVLTKTSA